MKLTVGDDLPLKLGALVPRAEDIRLTLGGCDYSGGVQWVSKLDDTSVRGSDLRHESAPKLGGVPTKASVKKAIVSPALEKAWEQACEKLAARERMNVTLAEAERATANFVMLPLDEQHNLLGDNPSRHREIGTEYSYRSKCTCDECMVVRLMVARERSGEFGKTERGVPALRSFQAEALAKLRAAPRVTVDYGKPGGDMTAWTKTHVDAQGNIHVETIKTEDAYLRGDEQAPKTATGLQMLMAASEKSLRAAHEGRALGAIVQDDVPWSTNRA
jgi:hypothetical protein